MRSVCLTSKDGLGRLDRLVINGAQDAEFHSDKFAVPAVPAVLGNMYLDMYHGRWDGGGCAVLCVVTSLRTTRQPDLMLVSRPLRPYAVVGLCCCRVVRVVTYYIHPLIVHDSRGFFHIWFWVL